MFLYVAEPNTKLQLQGEIGSFLTLELISHADFDGFRPNVGLDRYYHPLSQRLGAVAERPAKLLTLILGAK